MNSISNPYDSLININPQSVSLYLSGQGWREVHSSERESIWEFNLPSGNRKARLLLPKDKTIPDFAEQLYDLIRALSKIESRPESEVFSSIKSASEIARKASRNVINLRLTRKNTSAQGIPAKKLGSLLTSFQVLVYAIAQYEEGIASESGKIANYIVDATTFSMTTTFKGSFGITLVNDVPEKGDQKGVLDDLEGFKPLPERTIQRFMVLIKASTEEEALKKNLIKVKRRAASSYRNFLLALFDSEADNIFEWGCPGSEDSEVAYLSRSEVLRAVEIANKTVTEEPIEIVIELAEWIGGNSRREDFEIKNISTDETYYGKVDPAAKDSAGNAIWNNLYQAKVREEIELNEATQVISRKHTLLYLGPLTEDPTADSQQHTTA
jgi:hypothetical protein